MTDGIDNVRRIMDGPEDVELPEGLAPGPGGDGPEPPAPSGPEEGEPERECARLALNDVGNGARFRLHFGADLIWEPELGWHVWAETHYALDRYKIAVRSRAQQLAALIEREVPFLELEEWQMEALRKEGELRDRLAALSGIVDEGGKPAADTEAEIAAVNKQLLAVANLKKALAGKRAGHRKFARSAGNTGKIDAALTEAAVHLAVRHEDLDANPLEVNCLSGLMRFGVSVPATGPDGAMDGAGKVAGVELIPHDRSQRVTKVVGAAYVRDATCPRFQAFLARIQPDPAMRAFLQRWFGLSMTGLPIQAMTFLHGAGANGKSVLVELIARLLGDYAADVRIETLTGRNSSSGAAATPDLVYLVNARMARASEPKEGEPLQDALIKSLTSGEPIMVRANFGSFFRFYPIFKLTMSGNHKPEIRSTDDGIWRRVNLVPFDVQIPEAERDPALGEKLWAERDGILQWLIDGLIDYLESGLQVPDQVRHATAEYREDSDPVASFLADCCEATGEDTDRLPARELMLAFNWWLDGRGEGKWSERRVSTRLKDKAGRWKDGATGRTFAGVKSSGISVYAGIRFTTAFAQRFGDAPRDHEGRPLSGRSIHAS